MDKIRDCSECGALFDVSARMRRGKVSIPAMCKDCRAKKSSEARNVNNTKHDKYLQKTYNITLPQYNKLLKAQGGGCAICGATKATNKLLRLFVDHSHDGGHVRGLLCHNCNTALGKFGDNISLLRMAAAYLLSDGLIAEFIINHDVSPNDITDAVHLLSQEAPPNGA
jgi:DNA-directed RNA polymerase subunit M/transcription elongation factor TFIIS